MKQEEARKKAEQVIHQMTLEEKVSQMLFESPALPRLHLPAYNWWNEALHGVARAGLATVFPQSIALSATMDSSLVKEIGRSIGMEGRIKNELYRSEGKRGIYEGLTFWSPNINLERDPRWGRGHETYGEDPYLTSVMGTAFVEGLQTGKEEGHPQAAACVKHLAVHSGPEKIRHGFNAQVSERDLEESYLPAFERVVRDAKPYGVMGAYNAINGVPCCCNEWLLVQKLRKEWGFTGYTVSDCGAIHDIFDFHHYRDTKVEAAAAAAENGCDLECGSMYGCLLEAVQKGYLTQERVDEALLHLLTVRFELDMDGEISKEQRKEDVARWAACMPALRALNERAAEQCLVLLKNDGILPLKETSRLHTMAVIGPEVHSQTVLKGNYNGTPSAAWSMAEGLSRVFPETTLLVEEGAHLYKDRIEALGAQDDQVAEAAALASCADVTVLYLGLDPSIEGEEGDASNEYAAGDKRDLHLPDSQQRLLEAVCRETDNVIVVLLSGGALELSGMEEHVRAVVQAWYPGEEGALAVARLLHGDINPTGRLPLTFYYDRQVTWDFSDYSMRGKTYRFFEGEPLYPFGFGLSYEYLDLVSARLVEEDGGRCVEVTVKNSHPHAVSMPLQLYAEEREEGLATPIRQLIGLTRVTAKAGSEQVVRLPISSFWDSVVDEEGTRRPCRGQVTYFVGDTQCDARSECLSGRKCLRVEA